MDFYFKSVFDAVTDVDDALTMNPNFLSFQPRTLTIINQWRSGREVVTDRGFQTRIGDERREDEREESSAGCRLVGVSRRRGGLWKSE